MVSGGDLILAPSCTAQASKTPSHNGQRVQLALAAADFEWQFDETLVDISEESVSVVMGWNQYTDRILPMLSDPSGNRIHLKPKNPAVIMGRIFPLVADLAPVWGGSCWSAGQINIANERRKYSPLLASSAIMGQMTDLYLIPHSREWFMALEQFDPMQALHTRQILEQAGRKDICGVCGGHSSAKFLTSAESLALLRHDHSPL
jgi:hypothetical protein